MSKYHADWITDERWFDPSTIEGEEWKPICEYEGYNIDPKYHVSTKGRVKNVWTDAILKATLYENYQYVHIGLDQPTQVHRLVLHAFSDESFQPGVHGHHLNKDPRDNRIENLAWVLPSTHNKIHKGTKCKVVDSAGEHCFLSQKEASQYLRRNDDYILGQIAHYSPISNSDCEIVDYWFQFEEDGPLMQYVPQTDYRRTRCKIVDSSGEHVFASLRAGSVYLNRSQDYIWAAILNGCHAKLTSSSSEEIKLYLERGLVWDEYIRTPDAESNWCRLVDKAGTIFEFESFKKASMFLDRYEDYIAERVRDSRPLYTDSYTLYIYNRNSGQYDQYLPSHLLRNTVRKQVIVRDNEGDHVFSSLKKASDYTDVNIQYNCIQMKRTDVVNKNGKHFHVSIQ